MTQHIDSKQVQVGLGERSYPIFIEQHLIGRIGRDLQQRGIAKRYGIIADDHVASLYGGSLLGSLADAGLEGDMLTFPRGEESKNLQTVARLASSLAAANLDRRDGLIALGGGVTGDITGFVASVYMRGIPFVQVPTTLLAQVDSSVGGKTGVDLPEGKNLVGTFYQPRAVYIDTLALHTLPRQELLGGLAEVIKYGMIADAAFFAFLENERERILRLDEAVIPAMIGRCCEIKARIVEQDEREADLRRILNFGHTIGHAVEAASGFTLIHGLAVAMGMATIADLSVLTGLLPAADADRLKNMLQDFGLPTAIPAHLDRRRIKAYLLTDKKTVGGRVFYVLPTGIGKVIVTDRVAEEEIDRVLGG